MMSTDLEKPPTTNAALTNGTHSTAEKPSPAATPTAANVPVRTGAECYDALLWRLWSHRPDNSDTGYLLGLTGCIPQSGVSTLASNLAIRAADHALGPVLLVDANYYSPELHMLVRGQMSDGIVQVLAGHATLDSCVWPTAVAGLSVLPFGTTAATDGLRFDPDRLEALLPQWREQYALVICDLPAVGRLGSALMLAGALDATLLVVRSARVTTEVAQQAARTLATDNVRLIGAVVTEQQSQVPNWLDRRI